MGAGTEGRRCGAGDGGTQRGDEGGEWVRNGEVFCVERAGCEFFPFWGSSFKLLWDLVVEEMTTGHDCY